MAKSPAGNISGMKAVKKALAWPGRPNQNKFIDEFCKTLERCGISVAWSDPRNTRLFVANVDYYVIHWPEAFFNEYPTRFRLVVRLAQTLMAFAVLKVRGTRIVWVVHNLQPHDLDPGLFLVWRTYSVVLARLTDGWMTLSPSTISQVEKAIPLLRKKPRTYYLHPPYPRSFVFDRSDCIVELGFCEAEIVYGYVGQIRDYKNLDYLSDLITVRGGQLLIAGQYKLTKEDTLPEPVGFTDPSRIKVVRGRLSDTEFETALAAIDVFIAPYNSFLHSGAMVHALCRGCVLVAPEAPFTYDLQERIGSDRVILYKTLCQEVLSVADRNARFLKKSAPNLEIFGQRDAVRSITNFFRSL